MALDDAPDPIRSGRRGAGGGALDVLIVDDEDAVRRVMSRGLQRFGYAVDAVATAAEARARLLHGPRYDLVVTDVRLGDGFGTEAVAEALTRRRAPAVLIVSGSSEAEALEARERLPTWVRSDFLAKPFTLDDLRASLEALGTGDARGLGGA